VIYNLALATHSIWTDLSNDSVQDVAEGGMTILGGIASELRPTAAVDSHTCIHTNYYCVYLGYMPCYLYP